MKASVITKIFAILSLFLHFQLYGAFNLSTDELAALEKLGVSNEKLGEMINKGDFSELKEKLDDVNITDEGREELKNQAKEYAQDYAQKKGEKELARAQEELNQKREELTNKAKSVADGAIKDADGLIYGYAASTISLTMLGVFAPSVVMTCRTKPSALVYAGTAAIYLVRELQNSKKFKLSALAEIEVVKMKLDKDKSINSNLDTAQEALDMQFKYINSYKSVLDKGFKSIQDKSKNAKMAAMGFMAASGVALAETYAFDMGACVAQNQWSPNRDVNHYYTQLIEDSDNLAEAYALYEEWQRIARGERSSLTLAEYERLNFLNDFHSSEIDLRAAFTASLKVASDIFLPSAFANEQITVEKEVISPELKDNKLLDYAADADKVLGVLLGGVSFAAASFIPWYGNFLKKIVASGTSRAVVFGAHGAVALYASQQLGDASKKMLQRMDQLQEIIDEVQKHGNKALAEVKKGVNSDDLAEIGQYLGFNPDRPIGEMSIHEADQVIRDIDSEENKERLKNELKDDALDFLKDKGASLLQNVQELFISRAWAQGTPVANAFRFRCYTPERCAPPSFPRFRESNLAPLNEFFQEYQAYGTGVFQNRSTQMEQAQVLLERRESGLNRWREQGRSAVNQQRLAKGERPIDFATLERNEAVSIVGGIAPHMRSRSQEVSESSSAVLVQNQASPAHETQISSSRVTVARGISALDYNVLTGLIERLEGSSAPYMNRQYQFSPIHPKEVPLFEAIHRRYQIVFSRAESL